MQTPQAQMTGSVWAIGIVSEVPEVKLHDWRVFEVQQADRTGRTRHFVGSAGHDDDGQCSFAIVRFDPATRRGLSELGRIYQLIGRGTGIGGSADYFWAIWKRKAGARDVVDVTPEIEVLLTKQEAKCKTRKTN